MVVDRTAAGFGADLSAARCQVRTYTFDANGRRTSLGTAIHGDGDCDGATNVTSTSTSFDFYDSADRPTTVPAVDTPTYATDQSASDITLGYFDDDLPRSVAQTVAGQTTTTVFTLDSTGRRSTATTSQIGTLTATLVRHYTDSLDNLAWTVATDTLGRTTTTRYAESIGADLGATIGQDGSADLSVANLRGDVVTTIPIPAAASGPAAGINGWSDYTEYGAPRTGSTPAATGGAVGYGWLGAQQRSTTTETAGLTLMGDRLYNATTGRFTSPDPEPGGSENVYNYPNDPINTFDLDGRFGWLKKAWNSGRNFYNRNRTAINIGLTVASFAVGGGALGGAIWAWRAYKIVKAARLARGLAGGARATRATSWLAGRMWTGRGATWRPADRGSRLFSRAGLRQYRPPAYKGSKYGWESNFESRAGARGSMSNNYHVQHRAPRRWAPWW